MRKVLALREPVVPDNYGGIEHGQGLFDRVADNVIDFNPVETDRNRGCFASLAPKVLSNGYSAIPVIPRTKDVPRSEPDWRRFCWSRIKSEDMKLYQQRYAGYGLGLACGFHGATIDIDAEDRSMSRDLMSAAEEIFSTTPLVRVGKEPRVSLIYACSGPIISYHLPQLEILGVGRYTVAYGDHPDTGSPYKWIRGHSPSNTPVSALPQITQSSVDLYIKAISPILKINYNDITFGFAQDHMEWMLCSRTELIKQLALAVFKGKPLAKTRARKMVLDGFLCVPQFKLPRS